MNIEGATLTIYLSGINSEENEINLDLNKNQLKIIQKVLGLNIDLKTGLAKMYGNKTLKSLYEALESKLRNDLTEE